MLIHETIILNITMKAKNQLVVISGILVLLATATIASSFNVQTAKASSCDNNPHPYGKQCISQEAQGMGSTTGGSAWGASVASAAQSLNGLGDFRANGCKTFAGC